MLHNTTLKNNSIVTDLTIDDVFLNIFQNGYDVLKVRAGRRTGKTLNAVRAFLLVGLSKKCQMLWVDTTYSNIKELINNYIHNILGTDFFKQIQINYQDLKMELPNGTTIHFRSATRPELMEGWEYQFCIINEAFIVLRKLGIWTNTIEPMINKNCKTILIGAVKPDTVQDWNAIQGYEAVVTPYESPHYTPQLIEKIKSRVTTYDWRITYMAELLEEAPDSFVSREDLRYYDNLPFSQAGKAPFFTNAYMHIDCTRTAKQTSDYVALGIMAEGIDKMYYLIDYQIERLDQEQQARAIIEMYIQYYRQFNIQKLTFDEKGNEGFQLWATRLARDEYNLSLPLVPLGYPNDKVTHFSPHVPNFKAGRVLMPSQHKYKNRLEGQLLCFPSDPKLKIHDDGVDMLSGLLDNFKTHVEDYEIVSGGAELTYSI